MSLRHFVWWRLMRNLSFTGTRRGMTAAQEQSFVAVLKQYTPGWLHHGSCIGADAMANNLARMHGMKTAAYPAHGAHRVHVVADVVHPPKPPLVRNHDIVNAGELLIAIPASRMEELRSGTWATIRYARRIGRRVVIVWPDGEVE